MRQDYGMVSSRRGVDAADARAAERLLDMTQEFMKLDTANDAAFKSITFTFNQNPPEVANTTTRTVVYRYKHNYTYRPTIWSLVQTVTTPASNFTQAYFQSVGVLAARTAFDGASFGVLADEKDVIFYVDKYQDTAFGGLPNNLIGTILTVRVYVFANDVGA